MAYWQQLRELYERLSMRQRILTGVAAVAVLGLIFGISRWQTERNFKPLFQDLSAEDAGLVLAKLKESGTEVRLENGGKVVKVPAERVDELRIQMASAGLPKSGRIGFELFDKANFGTSEFAEQVNYHRAVEGELERSVMSLQEVESARVHITFPRQSLFLENRQPAKASVLLKFKPGSNLSKSNIQAITHLASSAVDGLTPDNVSVLDMRGNLLSRPRRDGESDEETSKQLVEYREKTEQSLREKIRATLEPLVGPDGFRSAVSLECDMASGDQSEETFDPTRSVMLNSQRSEDGSAPAASNGVPGTASNLPRPTSRPGTAGGAPLYRRSESTTFQTSRVVRHIKFPQGQIKRLSASVLLDHTVRMDGTKRIVEPPPAERLRAIKDIVSAAVGFQQERGDQIIVEALPFETTRNTPTEAAAPAKPAHQRLQLPTAVPEWLRVPLEGHLNWLVEQSWVPAVLIVLMLGVLYGLFRILRMVGSAVGSAAGKVAKKLPVGKKKGQHVDVTLDGAVEAAPDRPQIAGAPAEETEPAFKPLDQQLREREQLREKMTREAMQQLELPKAEVRKGEVLSRHISDLVTKDSEAAANLIRTWMEGRGN